MKTTPNKLDEKQVQLIRECRRQGVPLQAIAEYLGVTKQTIEYHCQDIEATNQDGDRTVTWLDLSKLTEWLPQLPWQGFLPLPLWYCRLLQLDWQSVSRRIVLAQQPPPEKKKVEVFEFIKPAYSGPRKKRVKKEVTDE